MLFITAATATVPVTSAPAPQTLFPPTSLTVGAAILSSGPAVPSPDVPTPAVDSTEAAAFPSSAMLGLTNNDDDLPESLNKIWEYSNCEIYYDNN